MRYSINIETVTELRGAINQLVKKLRKQSPSGQHLSLTERSTMSQLYQNGSMLPSELAANEHITNQSMSQILNNLDELGYILRTPSETDKRKVHVSLTEKGTDTWMQLKHERDEWLHAAITAVCTEEEQALFQQIIRPLQKVIDLK